MTYIKSGQWVGKLTEISAIQQKLNWIKEKWFVDNENVANSKPGIDLFQSHSMIKQTENEPFSSQQRPKNWSVVPTPVSLWRIEKILQIVTKTCSLVFKKYKRKHKSVEDMHRKKETNKDRGR